MRLYSKKREKGRSSRRQKRQRGGEVTTTQPGSNFQEGDSQRFVQDAINKMKTMDLQTLNRTMASGLRKFIFVMSGIMNAQMSSLGPIAMPDMNTIGPAISTALQTGTPAEFSAFTGNVNINTAVFFVMLDTALPDYDSTKNPPINTENVSPVLISAIQKFFILLKTVSPEDVLRIGGNLSMENRVRSILDANPQVRSQTLSIINHLFIIAAISVLGLQFTNIAPDEIMNYPVWNTLANDNIDPARISLSDGTILTALFVFASKLIEEFVVDDIISSSASTSTTTQPDPNNASVSTTTQPPSRIPAGMIAWINANMDPLTKPLKTRARAAAQYIGLVYPTTTTAQMVEQEANKLSVKTSGSSIPAAMVSWLNAEIRSTPRNLKSKLMAASTYVRRAWPSQTTPALIQAAANEIIML